MYKMRWMEANRTQAGMMKHDDLETLSLFRARAGATRVTSDDLDRAMQSVLDRDDGATRLRLREARGRRQRFKTPLRIAAATTSVAAAATLVFVLAPDSGSHRTSPTVIADGLSAWSPKTASDIVSYTDEVAVVTAVDATEVPDQLVPTDPDDVRLINRQVVLRVDKLLWQRKNAPSTDENIAILTTGWVVDAEHGKRLFQLAGQPYIEIGSTYLMPLIRDGNTWIRLIPQATFKLSAGRVALATHQDGTLAKGFAGRSMTQVAQILASAKADPQAVARYNLGPTERLCAVRKANGGSASDLGDLCK